MSKCPSCHELPRLPVEETQNVKSLHIKSTMGPVQRLYWVAVWTAFFCVKCCIYLAFICAKRCIHLAFLNKLLIKKNCQKLSNTSQISFFNWWLVNGHVFQWMACLLLQNQKWQKCVNEWVTGSLYSKLFWTAKKGLFTKSKEEKACRWEWFSEVAARWLVAGNDLMRLALDGAAIVPLCTLKDLWPVSCLPNASGSYQIIWFTYIGYIKPGISANCVTDKSIHSLDWYGY